MEPVPENPVAEAVFTLDLVAPPDSAYSAAYVLDPVHAVKAADGVWYLPAVTPEQEAAVIELVKRVGGTPAARQLRTLLLAGYPKNMGEYVAVVAESVAAARYEASQAAISSKKRSASVEMPVMTLRSRVWDRFKDKFPELTPVVLRLMACHATTCATERNWSLWGRVYTSARNALGLERAKKMIAICTNSRMHVEDAFAVSLSVIEGVE